MSTSADAGDRPPVVDREGARRNGHVWGRRGALNDVGRIARVCHQAGVLVAPFGDGCAQGVFGEEWVLIQSVLVEVTRQQAPEGIIRLGTKSASQGRRGRKSLLTGIAFARTDRGEVKAMDIDAGSHQVKSYPNRFGSDVIGSIW